jgi:hypothetical protein
MTSRPKDDGSTDWRVLREFAAVDLTRSFVLSWEVESGILQIDVDLLLTSEHPFYEKPRPAEKVCIRAAVIEFPLCDRIESDHVTANSGPAAVAGQLAHGAIKGLRRLADGRYEISGDFGVVLIDAERPIMRLKGP